MINSNQKLKTEYIIYDGRAVDEEGKDEAFVMSFCETLKEAIEEAPDYGDGCCVWEALVSYLPNNKCKIISEKLVKIV